MKSLGSSFPLPLATGTPEASAAVASPDTLAVSERRGPLVVRYILSFFIGWVIRRPRDTATSYSTIYTWYSSYRPAAAAHVPDLTQYSSALLSIELTTWYKIRASGVSSTGWFFMLVVLL